MTVDTEIIGQAVLLVGIGALAGVAGGMLGIGGGLIMIPALVFLRHGADGPGAIQLYGLAAISTSALLVLPAALRHAQLGAVSGRDTLRMLPFAVVGIAVGVWFTTQMAAHENLGLLRRLLGAVVLAAVFGQWLQIRAEQARRRHEPLADSLPAATTRGWLFSGVIGGPGGFLAGMLGIGGGVWAVPVQQFVFHIGLREAIATSTFLIAFTAPLAAIAQGWYVAHNPQLSLLRALALSACLAPGALIGGWLGADLTHRLPIRWVRVAFCVLLSVAALRLILAA